MALSLANWATRHARAPCFLRTGTNLAAICGTCPGRVANLARGSRMSARKQANGPRAAEKGSGSHWSRKGGGPRPRKELGPRSRWSPLIPVLPRGPGCRAALRDPPRERDVSNRSDVTKLALSRELGDPPRRSDVNNRSGATKLALSLANWATRLAEVM